MTAFIKNHLTFIALILVLLTSLTLSLKDLSKIPAGLYWDEMDAGYQAYSFLKTGKDYFGDPLPIQFHSFAEFRTPILIYTTIPFVAMLGLTAEAVRLPSVVFGLLGVIAIYFLAEELFQKSVYGLMAAIFLAFSPWYLQYSRMGFEIIILTPFLLFGLLTFYKGLKSKRWLLASAILFGLLPYTYSTAKLFTPIIIGVLIALYHRDLVKLPKKYLIAAGVLFCYITLPFLLIDFLGPGNHRFDELSLLSDPTLTSQIDYLRSNSTLAYGNPTQIGAKPNLLDRAIYNKPTYLLGEFTTNYLEAFSTQFLFISGDPNLRQSPSASTIGEFYKIILVTIILGCIYLVVNRKRLNKRALLLVLWLLLAPIPSALTRDGGMHASRLFLMLPVVSLISSLGLVYLYQISKGKLRYLLVGSYCAIWLFEAVSFYSYYYGPYRIESALVFNYGFDQAVQSTIANEHKFDQVIIDAHNDSALMAYLFTAKFDPTFFQHRQPLSLAQPIENISGFQFGNIYILPPGERSWEDTFNSKTITKSSLIIVASSEFRDSESTIGRRFAQTTHLEGVIRYPDNTPDFYLISYYLPPPANKTK